MKKSLKIDAKLWKIIEKTIEKMEIVKGYHSGSIEPLAAKDVSTQIGLPSMSTLARHLNECASISRGSPLEADSSVLGVRHQLNPVISRSQEGWLKCSVNQKLDQNTLEPGIDLGYRFCC